MYYLRRERSIQRVLPSGFLFILLLLFLFFFLNLNQGVPFCRFAESTRLFFLHTRQRPSKRSSRAHDIFMILTRAPRCLAVTVITYTQKCLKIIYNIMIFHNKFNIFYMFFFFSISVVYRPLWRRRVLNTLVNTNNQHLIYYINNYINIIIIV